MLLENAKALGAAFLATGHYARTRMKDHKIELLRGKDPKKDQSYVLSVLTQKQLIHALFPVGEFAKEEIRQMAAEFQLPVADRAESL